MIELLGQPLEKAVSILESKGYCVKTIEARSRKGVEGDSLRVIRITEEADGVILITYSEFKTLVYGE